MLNFQKNCLNAPKESKVKTIGTRHALAAYGRIYVTTEVSTFNYIKVILTSADYINNLFKIR